MPPTGSTPATDTTPPTNRLWFLGCLLIGVVFSFVFCRHLFVVRDLNVEALDTPLATLHLKKVRETGLSIHDYFTTQPVFVKLKEVSPQCKDLQAHFGWFWLEFFACQMPFPATLIYFFQRLLGEGQEVITVYSTFFALIAVFMTVSLGRRMFGRGTGLLAGLFMISSISFLLHTKTAYSAMTISMCLMIGLAGSLYSYCANRRRRELLIVGILLGLMYLVGWIVIVFACMMVATVLLSNDIRHCTCSYQSRPWLHALRFTTINGLLICGTATLTTILFVWSYSTYFNGSFGDIFRAIHDVMAGRFHQSSGTQAGWIEGSWFEHVHQLFRRTFFNMRDLHNPHHIDKQIEGMPAVACFAGLALLPGLYHAFRKRTPADCILLIWMGVIFIFVAVAFQFEHRYILLCLPAMSILGARALLTFYKNRVCPAGLKMQIAYLAFLIVGISSSLASTYLAYYWKWADLDFMNLRFHGQAELAEFIKETGPAADTMVIFGDPVQFPHGCFLFNVFDHDYDIDYWTNRIKPNTPLEKVRAWEQALLKTKKRIIYAFSNEVFHHPYFGSHSNDWRLFLTLHPEIQKPTVQINYSDGTPSIFIFVIEGNRGKAIMGG